MEEPTARGASDPDRAALRATDPFIGYDGRTLSREDVAAMIAHGARYSGILLTDREALQLAGTPHAAAKRHGNYRYERGYAHGRSDFEREGPLPDIDDPRDEQTEKIALAIRAVAEEWAAGLYDCGIRAVDLPDGSSDEPGTWQEAVASAKAADAVYLVADGQRAADLAASVEHAQRLADTDGEGQ